MKAQGVKPQDTAVLPADVDPSLVLASDAVLTATAPESSSHWLLWTVGCLAVLSIAGGVIFFMMNRGPKVKYV